MRHQGSCLQRYRDNLFIMLVRVIKPSPLGIRVTASYPIIRTDNSYG
ncbi:hypothetical protein H1P_1540015 [Hyella patelloides LEGE 07179]|uniref:Uncharacterized protein n=1 Tax=Hyella patelloides LEGE 07179 TaxID=945734 RepID=A0A563VMC3_9CYAN|nr:hypothetical protein H1P_1540015 [Hyella patelloides LEGE 07179]